MVFLKKNNCLFEKIFKPEYSLDITAQKHFRETIGFALGNNYFEQLYTYYPEKKQELWVVYYILFSGHHIRAGLADNWHKIKEFAANIEDRKIIEYAVLRLRWKIEYTNVVYSLLPDEFTFNKLQNVYEAILDRSLDKRNFRKKILSLNIVKSAGKKIKTDKLPAEKEQGRPAQMFSFRKKKLTFVRII